MATKPEGWVEGNEFPADAVSYTATQTDSAVNGLKSCKATMTDLKENTTYLYRVGNDEKWSDTYSFTTQALGQDQEFSFLFAGDPQIGASGNSAADTTNWQNTMSRSLQAFPQTSFLLSAGDQVNSRDSDTEYEGFLSPDAMRLIPLATNVGNHDNGSERYTSYYNMPNVSDKGVTTGSGSGDYWFMYNGMLVMSINSNNTDTAVHRAFLQETLNNHQEATWTVVTFHHSTYSVANHYSDSDIQKRRTELSPVFSELGIDVVLMGHDHYYTRTYMMNGCNAVIPEGNDVTKGEKAPESVTNPAEGQVFYLTANSASGSKYYARNGQLASGWPEYVAVQDQSNKTTITNVTVTRNSFTVDTYYTDKDVLQKMDSFTIYRTEDPTIRVPQTETGKITIQDGKAFNPMTGVSAQDYEGNDITELVHVTVYNADTGEQVQYVDTSKTGNYRIVYDVTDTYGKTASAEQLVEVVKNTDENPGQNPDENPSENPDENPGQISGTGSGNGQTDNNGKGNGLATAGTSQSSKATTVKTGDEAPLVLFGVIMLLAAGAAVVVLRRRSIR
ncbi:metallophosphoesterase [Dorea sp. YH-dor228]|uniref:metallophosphoesterase n=1 Tax=Dorea sp. YH-dor228 TaxID=3151120 RepID=UPI0032429FA1